MGGYYVNLFNLFGRTWQVNLHGRGRFPHAAQLGRTAQGAQQARPDGAAGHVGQRERASAGRSCTCGTTCTRRRPSTAIPRRASAPARRSRLMQQHCATSWACRTNGPTITYMQIQAGNDRAMSRRSCSVARCWCSSCWRRNTKAGSCRLSVILVVPMCLLVLGDRHADRALAGRHLRANRLPGAGGHGGEERDFDRRICAATARTGPRPATQPRSKPAACACGRS